MGKSARIISMGLLAAGLVGSALAAAPPDRSLGRNLDEVRPSISGLRLEAPARADAAQLRVVGQKLDPSLVDADGAQQVIIRLRSPATARIADGYFSARINHRQALKAEQNDFLSRLLSRQPSARVIGSVQHVLNAVFVEVPASALAEIANDPDVLRVAPVGHYELDLSETVPYIGAATVQAAGIDGTGVTVAVLDSGIDYTHADLGGSGDPAEYAANDGTIIEPGTFPTAKVTGGYDFLGNVWPTGPGGFDDPPMPDPDPLDDLALEPGAFAGHGTHVADIIAGANGVAPGASLYGVKVCASLSSACNGISLILGMEFSVDPNGDGDTSDRVDIINMSLGADYDQPFDDDLSAAVDNASALGTLTVSSAGNCGDLPYCTGTPSSAPTAIAVAQTQVPSALAFQMNVVLPESEAGLYEAVKYAWTPDPTGLIQGLVQYGDTDGDNLNGCDPFDGDLTGQIVAVDRGDCFFSDKVRNIENAGGVLGIVMLTAPGAPFSGGFGGGDPINIPGFNISQADGDILRAGNAVVQFGPEFSSPLVGFTVSSTARGPDMSFNAIKPEIGAPGASVSAEVGTGTGRTPFGGTSGAGPMVAGSAALLQEACRDNGGDCSPLALKALLMNNGFRDVISDTTGGLAEITRIGGGEVRVDQSAAATFWAYSPDDNQPSLSLGFLDLSKPQIIHRDVEIVNLTSRSKRISVTPTFRYANDAAAAAISAAPNQATIKLPGGQARTVRIKFEINPANLTGNPMNSGSVGNNPAALSAAEYDGYLLLEADDGDEVALPWHVLPRQAAAVQTERRKIVPRRFPQADVIGLNNLGAGIAQNDVYSIIGLSDEMPRGPRGEQSPMPDLRAAGVTTFLVPPTFCSAQFLWVFAVNTWDRQTHLVPVSHQIYLDTNQDGTDDYLVLNRDLTLTDVTDGRQLSWAVDLSTGNAAAFFFAEHATNTGNTMMYVCGEQVGLSADDILATAVDVTVVAQDFYNGGPGDVIEDITITPLGERFLGLTDDLGPGQAGALEILDFGPWPGNSEEGGLLLVTNGDRGAGARGGATEDTEAQLILAPGVKPPAKLTPPQNDTRKDGRYD